MSMSNEKKRLIVEVDPLIMDVLAANGEVSKDASGRFYGVPSLLARYASKFGGKK